MYFRAPLGTLRAEGGRGAWLAAMACTLLALVLGLYPTPLIRACGTAGSGRQNSEQQAAE
jgi:hypothetical protein